jgi:hypothetical protein
VTEDSGGTGASAGVTKPEFTRPPLLVMIENYPDLFKKEVLERLDPIAGRAARTAVVRSGLPHFGGAATRHRVDVHHFCHSLPMLVWAATNGCHWQKTSTCKLAAAGGHLEVLQWARENGCPWDTATCASAAEGGHLEVLTWAREHGCPWLEDLDRTWTSFDPVRDCCALAAAGGHLEVLQWAHEHGCPWDTATCAAAAGGGHLEVLKWARKHGCPW